MSDRILVPIADGKVLALTMDAYQEALNLGNSLLRAEQPKQQDDEKPLWLSVREVARLCNISETFLYDEIRLKHIHARPFGRAKRIHRDFVEHQTGDLMGNDGNDE